MSRFRRRRSTRPFLRVVPTIVAFAALIAGGWRYFSGRLLTAEDFRDEQSAGWKYVPLRRLLIFLEASIDKATRWVVFEPDDKAQRRRHRKTG
jgi:phage tail sheath protein FI